MPGWWVPQRLSTGTCWLQAGDKLVLGLYTFDFDESMVVVDWLDGVKSRSGEGAFADLLQRGIVTFFLPGGTSE